MIMFWEQFNKSTIVSGFLAIAVWSALIYMAIVGQVIPDTLSAGGALILGFFFGARSGQQSERIQALNDFARAQLTE